MTRTRQFAERTIEQGRVPTSAVQAGWLWMDWALDTARHGIVGHVNEHCGGVLWVVRRGCRGRNSERGREERERDEGTDKK